MDDLVSMNDGTVIGEEYNLCCGNNARHLEPTEPIEERCAHLNPDGSHKSLGSMEAEYIFEVYRKRKVCVECGQVLED
jgi:hypothetical protein